MKNIALILVMIFTFLTSESVLARTKKQVAKKKPHVVGQKHSAGRAKAAKYFAPSKKTKRMAASKKNIKTKKNSKLASRQAIKNKKQKQLALSKKNKRNVASVSKSRKSLPKKRRH